MWQLIGMNLAYLKRMTLVEVAKMLLFATAINVILPILHLTPAADDDFKLIFFYPIFTLFIAFGLGLTQVIDDYKEKRLVLQSSLPCTWNQLGAARVLTPAIIGLLTLLIAELVMLFIVLLSNDMEIIAWRFLFLAFFGGVVLMVLQLPILIMEIRQYTENSQILKWGFVCFMMAIVLLIGLRALSRYVDLPPEVMAWFALHGSIDPESWSSNIVIHSLAWFMTGINFLLFKLRSLTTD